MPKKNESAPHHGGRDYRLPTFVVEDYPGSDLERTLSHLAELTGNLRMQMFLRRIQDNWPEGVDTFSLGWAPENDRVKAVVMVHGDDNAAGHRLAEYIQGMFWHEDACFVNLVDKHFEDNNIDFSRTEVESLIRQVAGEEAVAQHNADSLEGHLPLVQPSNPPKPRM